MDYEEDGQEDDRVKSYHLISDYISNKFFSIYEFTLDVLPSYESAALFSYLKFRFDYTKGRPVFITVDYMCKKMRLDRKRFRKALYDIFDCRLAHTIGGEGDEYLIMIDVYQFVEYFYDLIRENKL